SEGTEARREAAGSRQRAAGRREAGDFSSPIEDGGGWEGAPSSLPLSPRRARRARAGRCASTAGTARTREDPPPAPFRKREGVFFTSPPPSKMGEVGRGLLLLFLSLPHRARRTL